MSDLKKTPLWECHVAAGARMVDFSGWHLPVQYDGILAEHHRTRADVSMFDTCHMGRFRVDGPSALAGLSGLLTADLQSMRDSQCRYGLLLKEDGGIVDDLIAYRFGAQKWMLVVNAGTCDKDRDWILARLKGDAHLADLSGTMGKLDIQGPRSPAVTAKVLGMDLAGLRYFHFLESTYRGAPVVISRTGYTGETGFEIYLDADSIARLWQDFLDAGVKPAGLGARDTLRLEAGLPLYGHELSEQVSPVEANMLRYANKSAPFIGKDALEARQRIGIDFKLTGFRIDDRQSGRAGNPVRQDGRKVGSVTSGSYAPTLGYSVGMAYVEPALAKIGVQLLIDTGRKELPATSVDLPFYRRTREGIGA